MEEEEKQLSLEEMLSLAEKIEDWKKLELTGKVEDWRRGGYSLHGSLKDIKIEMGTGLGFLSNFYIKVIHKEKIIGWGDGTNEKIKQTYSSANRKAEENGQKEWKDALKYARDLLKE